MRRPCDCDEDDCPDCVDPDEDAEERCRWREEAAADRAEDLAGRGFDHGEEPRCPF